MKSPQQRWLGIDALRGFAVLCMITQHVSAWVSQSYQAKWLAVATGAIGGIAAPIFVTLSGLGVIFLSRRHEHCDRQLIIRGVMIMGFGYLMNFLTPHWFSMQSWYVLHMIGFGLVLAPLLRRVPTPVMFALFVGVIVGTVLIQNDLHTPFRLYNHDMSAPTKPGGVFRFALAEGYFPVFPWLAFMVSGLLTGRWLLNGKPNHIWRFALILIGTTGVLCGLSTIGLDFTHSQNWVRFFKFRPTFYPALTPITLFLIGLSLLFITLFTTLDEKLSFQSGNFMVCLGRASLTFLIVHVAVIRESAYIFRFFHTLPVIPAIITVALVLVFFSVAAVWWQKINYRYGAEWLLRKVAR